MNKKYFCKYLPVEGEIKDTDKPTEKGFARLFLCSRDIQVDDKVFLENGYNYFATVVDKIGGSDRDIVLDKMPEQRKTGTLDFREMIKVIGEISSDALSYVKEGNEFDEEETRYASKATTEEGRPKIVANMNAVPFLLESLGQTTLSEGSYIQVKGPCGHFH